LEVSAGTSDSEFRGQFERGRALWQRRQFAEALALFDGLALRRPEDAAVRNARSAVLNELGHYEAALAESARALALAPDYVSALLSRTTALKGLHRLEEALAVCDRAVALQPQNMLTHVNRAAVLRDLQRPEESLAAYDRAVALEPRLALAHADRAVVLQDLGRADEAVASCDRALAIDPASALAYAYRGGALHDLGQYDAALASYERAQQLAPQLDRAFLNAAFIHLLRGNLALGWELFERRRKPGPLPGTRWSAPLWSGQEALAGKTLFLYWEQGFGDTVQFARYAQLARDRGARVLFSAQDSLRELLRSLGPGIELLGERTRPAEFDLHAPLLSLPRAFATTLESIPSKVPYLSPDPQRVAVWRRHLGTAGLKVGIGWQGRATRSVDVGRSCPLKLFEPLAAVPGVRLISLQRGAGTEQLAELSPGVRIETLGTRFDQGDFLETASAMAALDLVISTCTSRVHVAGAIGVPTWVLLKTVPDWRWLLGRTDSPWYPTLRLFRQSQAGDWDSVFAGVKRALENEVAQRGVN
jgi:tetratricopeptide (TPR) repeat protein